MKNGPRLWDCERKVKLIKLKKKKLVPSSEVYEECFKSGNPEKNHGTTLGNVSKSFQLFINEKKIFQEHK